MAAFNNLRRWLLEGTFVSPYQLSVTDWNQSLFWALLGVVSVGACVASTNQRTSVEYARLELQQQKNELLAEMLRAEQRVTQQQQQLQRFEAVLQQEDSSSSSRKQSWAGLRQQLLAALSG